MRGVAALIVLIAMTLRSPAGSAPLVGERFVVGGIPVEWQATNAYKALWVYKVVPQNFSSSVISNAMIACSFKSLNMVNVRNKKVIRFQDHKREDRVGRFLEISATSGWMQYCDMIEPTNVTASVQGVPNADECERLGLDLLLKLGIDRTQLAPGPRLGGSKGILKVLTSGEEHYVGVQTRHIAFIRQIDGFSFTGAGLGAGFWVEFGSDGRLREFELVWRNLLPYELRGVASNEQILEFIKTGRAVHSADVDLRTARRFTVKSLIPKYLGAPGGEPQEVVYPIASLDVQAEFSTNKLNLEIACPILAAEAPSTK